MNWTIKFANCFSTSTYADLIDENGQKRIGSAQFWRKGRLLQHGEIILDPPKELWEEVEDNHNKYTEKGNKSAGARARKSLGQIKKLVTEYRKLSVEDSKFNLDRIFPSLYLLYDLSDLNKVKFGAGRRINRAAHWGGGRINPIPSPPYLVLSSQLPVSKGPSS